jgi:hypothetical protein
MCDFARWIIDKLPALATVAVALWATFSWRRQLSYQRADDLIGAALNLRGAVYKALAYIDYGEHPRAIFGERIDEAYAAGREFNRCLWIAKHYYKRKLRDVNGDEAVRQIHLANELGRAHYALEDEKRKGGASKFDDAATPIKKWFDYLAEKILTL